MVGDNLELLEDSWPLIFPDLIVKAEWILEQLTSGDRSPLKIRTSEVFHSPCGSLLICILKAATIALCIYISGNRLGYLQ